ncbi:MAG: hypothetical protein COV99_02660 [Bacteroidetes bacterium CG12_big_fil_rev_8_21_14_0_65_60_17]|nr:MAG: hypothetical protein COV99_02660 [Bacteroidetes bacterium CG12_big_fil_rev_8_21_14_0_65_60_17]
MNLRRGKGVVAPLTGHHAIIMSKAGILFEFLVFLRERKKYWLLPIVVVLVLVSLLIVLTQGSALAPFIYALF